MTLALIRTPGDARPGLHVDSVVYFATRFKYLHFHFPRMNMDMNMNMSMSMSMSGCMRDPACPTSRNAALQYRQILPQPKSKPLVQLLCLLPSAAVHDTRQEKPSACACSFQWRAIGPLKGVTRSQPFPQPKLIDYLYWGDSFGPKDGISSAAKLVRLLFQP